MFDLKSNSQTVAIKSTIKLTLNNDYSVSNTFYKV